MVLEMEELGMLLTVQMEQMLESFPTAPMEQKLESFPTAPMESEVSVTVTVVIDFVEQVSYGKRVDR